MRSPETSCTLTDRSARPCSAESSVSLGLVLPISEWLVEYVTRLSSS